MVDADAVPGTGSARGRLFRIGVRLALTAGFAIAGWLLCVLAAPAACASELPQTPAPIASPADSSGGLLGGLLGNNGLLGGTVNSLGSTVNSLLGTVNTTLNSTLGTVGSTVTSLVDTVGTTVVTPAVTTVTQAVTPVVAPLAPTQSKPVAETPTTDNGTAPTTPAQAKATPLPTQPSPVSTATPLTKQAHHGATIPAPTKATQQPMAQLRPDSGPLPLPKAPQPAPQQPLAPAPTISTGHGPNGGNKHAVQAVTASATGGLPALLTTVASHPIIVPGDMPGLPSVSPD